jgi:hypothetical protein
MKLAIVIAIFSLVACVSTQEEDAGECLKWRTTVVEKKERLPYPMRGVVVREEEVVYCAIREEIKHA